MRPLDRLQHAVEFLTSARKEDLEISENEANLLGEQVIHRTDIPVRLEPEEPRQIHMETLFGIKDISVLDTLSEVELQQFKSPKHALFGMQEGKCNGGQVPFRFRHMTIDHIHPRSKGDRTQEYLIQALKDQRLRRE